MGRRAPTLQWGSPATAAVYSTVTVHPSDEDTMFNYRCPQGLYWKWLYSYINTLVVKLALMLFELFYEQLCCIMFWLVKVYCAALSCKYVWLYCVIVFFFFLYCVMASYVMLCCVVLCCGLISYVKLYFVMTSYVMLCHVMLYFVVTKWCYTVLYYDCMSCSCLMLSLDVLIYCVVFSLSQIILSYD